MKLPRDSQASQQTDPCLFCVARLCIQLTRCNLGHLLSLAGGTYSVCPSARGGGRDGTDQSPQSSSRVFTVRSSECLHACFRVCLFFQKGEQAYLLVVIGGHGGRVLRPPQHLV